MPSRLVIVFVVDGLRPDAIPRGHAHALPPARRGRGFHEHPFGPPDRDPRQRGDAGHRVPSRHHGIVGNRCTCPRWTRPGPSAPTRTGACSRSITPPAGASSSCARSPSGSRRAACRWPRSARARPAARSCNPAGPAGAGVLVSGYFEPGARVAWPDAASAAILAASAPRRRRQGAGGYEAAVTWTQRVLREHVLPELRPAVVINWLTEPDHTQHCAASARRRRGRRSATPTARSPGVLAALERRGVAGSTEVVVASDHGFTSNTGGVDVVGGAGRGGAQGLRRVHRRRPGQQRAGGRAPRRGRRRRAHRAHRAFRVVAAVGRRAVHRGPGAGRLARRRRGHVLAGRDPSRQRRAAPRPPGDVSVDVGRQRLRRGGQRPRVRQRRRQALPERPRQPEPVERAEHAARLGAGFKSGIRSRRRRATSTSRRPRSRCSASPTARAWTAACSPRRCSTAPIRSTWRCAPSHTATAGAYRAALQVTTAEGRRYVDKSWRG